MNEIKVETNKLLDFSPKDIKIYLKELKNMVLENKYTISRNSNREENKKFIEDYRIDSRKEKEILMNLEYDDFCYAVNNRNPKFSHEVLYIFNKEYELDKWGELVSIDIYIKTNKIQTSNGEDYMIFVSFHERNKPIRYLFK
ncbi:MAG: hypothetical protein N4A40_10570 [Tissierellales bacterium]|jgi:hypothetical protein|nr:hypothetical protein [Tissierellales bacterium]